jgi:flagellar hook-associated protein 1 FlgK
VLSISGSAITPTSGTIGGQLDALTTILPTQLASLDTVASQLASQVNAIHHTGFDATGAAGGDVFSGTTAGTIALALTGPDQVAASNTAGSRDGSIAQAIAKLATAAGGPDSVYRAFVAGVSTQADLANNTVDSQTALVQSVSAARSSVAGVNIDEEMVNLLAAQRGYEASSRVLTTLDSVLDTLINRTGVR